MKNALALLIFILFVACKPANRKDKLSISDSRLEQILGFYEYQAQSGGNNQFILIDTLSGKYYGIYYMAEPRRGKGQEYYANSLSNLEFTGDSISFVLDAKKLFNSKPVSPGKRSTNMPLLPGTASGNALNFSGVYANEVLKLNCSSENGNCPNKEMTFRKIPLPE